MDFIIVIFDGYAEIGKRELVCPQTVSSQELSHDLKEIG